MRVWSILSALAADPSPARLCAEAAEGAEVEVCVKLAAVHPEATDALAAALAAHIDRRGTADRELLSAVLLLHDDATVLQGLDVLDLLTDPRRIPPLLDALDHPTLPVALRAVEALARTPVGHAALQTAMLDPTQALAVRIRSAEALSRSGDAAAVDGLVDALRQRYLPLALRDAIHDTLAQHHPARLPELRREISKDGTPWLTAAGAVGLGYGLAVAGQASSPELLGLGAAAGTLTGGTLGYLLGQGFPTEAGDASFIAVNSLVGTAGVFAVAWGLDRDRPGQAAVAGLGGQLGGLALGLALHRAHPGRPQDSVEALLVGGALAVAVGGVLQVSDLNGLSDPEARGRQPFVLGSGLGLLGGTVIGHLVAPRVKLHGNDWAMIALAGGTGAAIGQFAPLGDNRRGSLPAVGAAAGTLAGYAMAGSIDPDWDALGSGAAGAVFGGFTLGGTALWIRPNDNSLAQGATLLGGLAGMGLGGLLADVDQDPIDDRDVLLAATASGWTLAHVAAFNQRRLQDPLARVGPLLVLPALAGGTVSALSGVLDVPITHTGATVSVGLWGAYVGGTIGALASDDPLLPAMIGGDLAALAGGLALSPLGGVSPTTIALADTGGIVLGATSLAVTNAFTSDTDALLVAAVAGAGAGFVGGALVGRKLRLSGRTRDVARLHLPEGVHWTVTPGPVQGDAYGATLQVVGW